MMTAGDLIKALHLSPHPEGGYYKEIYRSGENTIAENGEVRSVCTAIYFLLEGTDRSRFHRIRSDEQWFFHLGQALDICYLSGGGVHWATLGSEVHRGESPWVMVPRDTWFGCKLKHESGYALVSCIVAPGFDFRDFELAKKDDLIREFPLLTPVIEEFTRETGNI
jgi:predicted cupin superfamily sugar epimerase